MVSPTIPKVVASTTAAASASSDNKNIKPSLDNLDDVIRGFIVKFLTVSEVAQLRKVCKALNIKFGDDKYYRLAASILKWKIDPKKPVKEQFQERFLKGYNDAARNALPGSALEQMSKLNAVQFYEAVQAYVKVPKHFASLKKEFDEQWNNYKSGAAGPENLQYLKDIMTITKLEAFPATEKDLEQAYRGPILREDFEKILERYLSKPENNRKDLFIFYVDSGKEAGKRDILYKRIEFTDKGLNHVLDNIIWNNTATLLRSLFENPGVAKAKVLAIVEERLNSLEKELNESSRVKNHTSITPEAYNAEVGGMRRRISNLLMLKEVTVKAMKEESKASSAASVVSTSQQSK